MKTLLKLLPAFLLLMFVVSFNSVNAQEDSNETGSKSYVKIKTMKIVNGDTIVTEKEYKGDGNMNIEDSPGGQGFGNFQFKSFNNPGDSAYYGNFSQMQDMLKEFNFGANGFFFKDPESPDFRFPHIDFDVDSMIKQFRFRDSDTLFPSMGDNQVIIKSFKNKDDNGQNPGDIKEKQRPDMDMQVFGKNDKGQQVTYNKKITIIEKENTKPNKIELPVDIFPNPADEKFNVSFELDPQNKTSVQITDWNGKELLKETIEKASGTYTRQFDLKDYAMGTYLIIIKQGKKEISKQIIIE